MAISQNCFEGGFKVFGDFLVRTSESEIVGVFAVSFQEPKDCVEVCLVTVRSLIHLFKPNPNFFHLVKQVEPA